MVSRTIAVAALVNHRGRKYIDKICECGATTSGWWASSEYNYIEPSARCKSCRDEYNENPSQGLYFNTKREAELWLMEQVL
jgi:hypothetical protein